MASAAGPRIAPKIAHVRGRRWRVTATLAAAAANPMSHAATKKAMTGLISTPQRASVKLRVAASWQLAEYPTAWPAAPGRYLSVGPVRMRRFGAARHR
jgi:hypothetical protein